MRVDLRPIIEQAQALLSAIEAKSRGPARDAAHRLMCALPIPSWADPAHGMTIHYGIEHEVSPELEQLRESAATWTKFLTWIWATDEDTEWPEPTGLIRATRALESFMPQNESVSANTAPVTS